jgi:hypothetical protein
VNPLGRSRFQQLDGLCNGNSPRQGNQQVNVVSNAAHSQCGNFIFARDAAEICMKPLPNFVVDRRSSLGGRKHHVDQTGYVTMRHAFSRPFGTTRSYQRVPRTASWAIFRPSLRDSSDRVDLDGGYVLTLSAVPSGLLDPINAYPGLRPGLFSDRPFGTLLIGPSLPKT